MQEPSLFTKIHNGEIPGEVIYEDDTCFVLLTIAPMTPGHSLVIPREQIDSLWDVSIPTYHHLMDVAKKIAGAIDHAYTYARVAMAVEGFGVPHAHIHVFGLDKGLETTAAERLAHNHQPTPEELKTEADKLRACL